jgi:hypothetical protein
MIMKKLKYWYLFTIKEMIPRLQDVSTIALIATHPTKKKEKKKRDKVSKRNNHHTPPTHPATKRIKH